MTDTKKLGIVAGAMILGAFFVLGWFGSELYRNVPPIPREVRTTAGQVVMTRDDILRG